MELGKLKYVDVRKQWQNEARNFTPWLAENIDEIADKIGVELEVEDTEVSAGPFSADILAKDTGTDRYVIIENQLEKTNHDHLGKSITYASVLNASTILWVATDFTEEHKKALDWLNDLTNEDISFYGIKLELLKIDDSKNAVNFDIISGPNQTVRSTRKMVNKGTTEIQKFQLEFWIDFKERLSKIRKDISLQTPRPQNWFDIAIGKAHIHVTNTCSLKKSEVTTGIYISNKIADEMLLFLEERKEEIEEKMGEKLIWDPYPQYIDKRIMLRKSTDLNNPQKREEALIWLTKYASKFRDVFSPIVQEF
jgi:hypothetical protein